MHTGLSLILRIAEQRDEEACRSGRTWVERQDADLDELVRTCPRGEWLLWALERIGTAPELLNEAIRPAVRRAAKKYALSVVETEGLAVEAGALRDLDFSRPLEHIRMGLWTIWDDANGRDYEGVPAYEVLVKAAMAAEHARAGHYSVAAHAIADLASYSTAYTSGKAADLAYERGEPYELPRVLRKKAATTEHRLAANDVRSTLGNMKPWIVLMEEHA